MKESIVERQLRMYNKRDIKGFAACFSQNIEVYEYPGKFLYSGMEKFYDRYRSFFEKFPEGRAELLGRMTMGNITIDYELVKGVKGEPFRAFAIYHVKDNLIDKVEFVRDNLP